jgi:hypothetical protein
MSHLDEEQLLELALGGSDSGAAAHARDCGDCAGRLEELEHDLGRLRTLDDTRLEMPAPPLPVRPPALRRSLPLRWLRVAASLTLVALGGAGGMRWLDSTRLEVVAYVPPAPPRHGLARLACPAGDLAVRMDTLRAGH